MVSNLNIGNADRIFRVPGRSEYIYLLEYRIVGNKADLEAVLPIIDGRLFNDPNLIDAVIQMYGIDRTNWNTDPRVANVISEELAAGSDMDDLLSN